MSNNGWICLHRDIQAHWLFSFDEPDKFMAWCDLLMSANHEDKKFMVKGRLVECKRGQVAMSQVTLQKRWKMSQNKLKRFLVLLKNDAMIDFETNDLTTIITICNYNKFQDNGRADGRPLERADGRGTDDQADDKQQLNNLTIKQNNLNTYTGEKPAERMNKKQSAKPAKKTTIPDDFTVSAGVLTWYRENGYIEDISKHLENFKDQCQAKGYEYADFDSAFKKAIRDDWASLRKLQILGNYNATHKNNNEPRTGSGRKLSLVEQAQRDCERLEERERREQDERVIN